MTGRPGETWKKFKFATPPDWVYALLVLVCLGGIGILAFAIVTAVVSQRASGYLPLTRSSSRTAALAFWIPVGLLIACPGAWAIGAFFGGSSGDSSGATLTGVGFWRGRLFLAIGLLGGLFMT